MGLRENFIERIFAYYRWSRMLDEEPTREWLYFHN
jgi:hypothetical protein